MYFAKAFIKVKDIDVIMNKERNEIISFVTNTIDITKYGLLSIDRYKAINRLYLNSLPEYVRSTDLLRSESFRSTQVYNKKGLPDWYGLYGVKVDVSNEGNIFTVDLLINYNKSNLLSKDSKEKYRLDSIKKLIFNSINSLPGVEVEGIDIVESVNVSKDIFNKDRGGITIMSSNSGDDRESTIFEIDSGILSMTLDPDHIFTSRIAVKNKKKSYIQKFLNNTKYTLPTGLNRVTKVLVRKRDDIFDVLGDYISDMYDKGLLLSKKISVYDIGKTTLSMSVDTMDGGGRLIDIDRILMGSTLVLYLDIPNAFAKMDDINELKQGEHYELDKAKEMDDSDDDEDSLDGNSYRNFSKKLNYYTNIMNEYDLARHTEGDPTDVAKGASYLKTINTIKKELFADGKEDRVKFLQHIPSYLREFIDSVNQCLGIVNIVVAYSDTIAYDEEYFINDYLKETLESMNFEVYGLSNSTIFSNPESNKRRFANFVKQVLEEDIQEYDSNIFKTIYDSVLKNVTTVDNDDTEIKLRSSIPGLEYYIYELYNTIKNGKVYNNRKEISTNNKEDYDEEIDFSTMSQDIFSSFTNSNFRNRANKFYGGFRQPTVTVQNISSTDVNELDKMIGLTTVKEECNKFAAFLLVNKKREELGYSSNSVSRHMVFTGNPGTAKSTTAILLAKKLFKMGVLNSPKVTMTSRDSLIERYVGWTAKKVEETIRSARGGILFVDEAYSLMDGDYRSYGYEAINTFVNYMEQKSVRDSTIIIFAGYKDEMKKFLQSNPGLPSRVTIIDFPDYNIDELMQIAKVIAESKSIKLSDGFMNRLKEVSTKYIGTKNFGNGRFIRNIIEKSMLTQAYRLSKIINTITEEELNTLEEVDFTFREDDYNISDKDKIGFIL